MAQMEYSGRALPGMNGKTQRVGQRKRAGEEQWREGNPSAAPIVGAVFGLLVKGVFSNALTLLIPPPPH
jgi:hypothetical protein